MRPIWWLLIGIVGTFIVLKVVNATVATTSTSSKRFKQLAATPEVYNLVKTNEFRELVKTKAFLNFMASLAGDQVQTVSATLLGATKKY